MTERKTDPDKLPNIDDILKELEEKHGYNITLSKKFIEKWERAKALPSETVARECFPNDACIICDTNDICRTCDTMDWCVTTDYH